MDNYTAISIVEGFCDYKPTEQETIEAWQHLIDTGLVWTLQGWFGRRANELIEQGVCSAPNGKMI
jgi:fatty acid-binding protein DegV